MAKPLFLAAVIFCLQPLVTDVAGVGLRWNYDQANDRGWNYDQGDPKGPENWHIHFPSCYGTMQSPINIKTNKAVYDEDLQPLDFSGYDITEDVHLKLVNVGGRTAEVIVSGEEIFIKGGSFQVPYKLERFHFHWGKNESRGSEHSIGGEFAPLEVHFVHSRSDDEIVNVSTSEAYELAVVSFLFEVGIENENYDPVIRNLKHILYPNNETDIPTFSLKTLLPSTNLDDYYRYMGSLTTPPCSESVIWTVVAEPIEISLVQLKKFRSLYDEEYRHLVKNYRPVQPVNNRTVSTTKTDNAK